MSKFILITTKIACLFFFVLSILGCDSQTESPQAPKVITQKIVVGTPPQPMPQKPPAQTPPAPKQQSATTQLSPPEKPQTPSSKIPMVPVAKKPQPTPEKTMAAVHPAAAPAQTEQAAVSDEKTDKNAPAPSAHDRIADKTTDKPIPDSPKEVSKPAETNKIEPDAKASESDLAKLIAVADGGYSPAGKVDPFLPLFEEKPVVPEGTADAEKQKKKRRMPLTPLERVDLSQLKLVGIIQAPSGNKALVEEASGKGYIIKKGTFIGIHAGRVVEIQKDRVVVEEEVENVLGQFLIEKKELKLQKPPGEF